jgi:hypothetical protein
MPRLDAYRRTMLAAFSTVSKQELRESLDSGGPNFASFIIDHGLGPLWHERTGRDEFRDSRMTAEVIGLTQEQALREVDAALSEVEIEYAVIKGAANRLLLYENPAIRACHDIDLLVRYEDRVRAALALVDAGFVAKPEAQNISHELVLSRDTVDLDLHWGLLRAGRLSCMSAEEVLGRRRKCDVWMLSAEDAFFMLLVHPAIAKHLDGWEMGMHRVVDIVVWLDKQSFDWSIVRERLEQNGVRTAAWATLSWVKLLIGRHGSAELDLMLADLQPGLLRRRWLGWWLRNDLSARFSRFHWFRLIGFSILLHDNLGAAQRAIAGRRRARKQQKSDLAVFHDLPS